MSDVFSVFCMSFCGGRSPSKKHPCSHRNGSSESSVLPRVRDVSVLKSVPCSWWKPTSALATALVGLFECKQSKAILLCLPVPFLQPVFWEIAVFDGQFRNNLWYSVFRNVLLQAVSWWFHRQTERIDQEGVCEDFPNGRCTIFGRSFSHILEPRLIIVHYTIWNLLLGSPLLIFRSGLQFIQEASGSARPADDSKWIPL